MRVQFYADLLEVVGWLVEFPFLAFWQNLAFLEQKSTQKTNFSRYGNLNTPREFFSRIYIGNR